MAGALILAAFVASRLLAIRAGLSVDPTVIGGLWQILALERLAEDLPGALLSLHAQPPLWNGLIGLFVAACGPDELCVSEGLWALHIGLTPVIAGLIWGTLRLAGVARPLAWGAAGLFALSPGALFYETFTLYTHVCCALLAAGAFAAALFARGARGGAAAALLAAALLCLTWPLFHPAWMLMVFAGLVAIDRRRALRAGPLVAFALTLALSLAPSAWNLHRHGLFSNGSWMGLNLAQTVEWMDADQRARCRFRPVIEDIEQAHRDGLLPGPPAARDKSVHDPAIIERSKECLAMAVAEIRAHPLEWAAGRVMTAVRSHRMWSWEYPLYAPIGWERMPIPDKSREGARWAEGAEGWGLFALLWGGFLLAAGAVVSGLMGRRAGLTFALLLQIAAFTAAAHVANGVEQNRMRHVIAPEWLMVTALGLDALRRRRTVRRESGSGPDAAPRERGA
ncbi:hypothetical protein P2H44_16845 [Albimonas sp. CAU 1670]|uniref:hypothetical protein n=1 Tax=Albimonas sp. CAU 1670 TaxID=3032599 RepID=UPI0023DAAA5A|nr:hypothetical protein [Albimonas sp. CAU 1670]MDF2234233.1 hypothetical protein [Albimonas sp. CAU 1670]